MIDVHQLRVFAAVAENLSFTRAAEQLSLSQSAVSHQVARLEQGVGVTLLLRQGRAVSLTPAGQEMLVRAKRLVAGLEETRSAVQQAARPQLGRMRIGATSTACQFIIPEALREFRECFADYSLSITPADSPQISALLRSQSIDLGLLVRTEREPDVTYRSLFEDELQFLLSPLHPWSRAGAVKRDELADQRLVLYHRNSATFRIIERYFQKMGAPLRDWIELGDIGAIKELVKLGLGVSITAEWVARPEVRARSLTLLPAPGARLRRTWCVAYPAGKHLSVAEQTFIGLCQSVGGQLTSKK